ncbi:unnamed protein product [Ceutorhynchus assimilis]|uniref:Uncharacterized protein n=1 Tax=Ceutorhynchus assimilis TaxID=467358 RepID=A0A9P0DGE4_9CUCU|nr:unnamed protein product [Ceutorhynchus assimilis]
MLLKLAPFLVLAVIFESVYSTEILFNALKQHVPKIRCKLHKIGSKLIPHMHSRGDPCEAADDHHHAEEFGEMNVENSQSGYGTQQLNGHSYGPSDREPTQFRPNNLYPATSSKPEFQNRPVDAQTGYQNLNIGEGETNNFLQTTEKSNIRDVDNNELILPNIKSTTQKIDNQPSTESWPTSLDIDIRMHAEEEPTTAKSYATVPTGGGRHIFKAPCKNGMIMTEDGCMEEI